MPRSRPTASSRCLAFLAVLLLSFRLAADDGATATASGSVVGSEPAGALNGDRFSVEGTAAWKGATNATRWWWQVEFKERRPIGAILQVVGDHPFVLRNAPRQSIWQWSNDGLHWSGFPETATTNETRLFRLHRLGRAQSARWLRFEVASSVGDFPTLREVEFYPDPQVQVPFPDWMVVVNTTHDSKLPSHGQEFIPLAKSCPGWSDLQAQQLWLDAFAEDFLRIEPRPLCGFLSGNFKDWCEVDRSLWRGTDEVLRQKNLPLWASCGGAQGLAILAESGVDRPWDCPHCRDPKNPRTPIYTHIGHTAQRPCGDYTGCLFERGPHQVRSVTQDPVFQNLPTEFEVMQSHCGQIEWPPAQWSLIATGGPGTQTKIQCLRLDNRYIYAAQFHIEMEGTPKVSRQIMGNFLRLAKSWGGYHSSHNSTKR